MENRISAGVTIGRLKYSKSCGRPMAAPTFCDERLSEICDFLTV